MDILVGKAADLSEGGRKIITHNDEQIGVLRAKGKLHAFSNICPHQGGPACEGVLVHKVEEIIGSDKQLIGRKYDENVLHLVCPWHGWEFNIETGRCAGDGKHRLRRYEVRERDGDVYVVV
ncbi:MAG: Rieske (2Fe-2S) protein [Pseudomonadota bacterium]